MEDEEKVKNLLLDRVCSSCIHNWNCEYNDDRFTCDNWMADILDLDDILE